MTTAANLVLADSVPANHTFVPIEAGIKLARWVDRDGTTSAGSKQAKATLSESSKGRPTNRVLISMEVPREQTVDGVTTVYATDRFNGEFILHETDTTLMRTDLHSLVISLLNHADVKKYVTTLEPVM
jgi:hypothetical protein